ncbi:MAG: hypothetical protein K2M04_08455 [Muribaculaceae bacterium]|nr:hypothetical protein [Muribaculaceae bacterium]
MTDEEKDLINDCRIMIVGTGDFISYLMTELSVIGFDRIQKVTSPLTMPGTEGILIEYIGSGSSLAVVGDEIPMIYPFDFIKGAGVIVVFPGDDRGFLNEDNVRLWAAEYMSGYSAFWNMDGYDWLREVLPEIRAHMTSDEAQKLAAHLCARIAANIAVGRKVKRFPRFYLVES